MDGVSKHPNSHQRPEEHQVRLRLRIPPWNPKLTSSIPEFKWFVREKDGTFELEQARVSHETRVVLEYTYQASEECFHNRWDYTRLKDTNTFDDQYAVLHDKTRHPPMLNPHPATHIQAHDEPNTL